MKERVQYYAKYHTLGHMKQVADWVVDQGKHIQQIAAPTTEEYNRARYVERQYQQLGLQDIKMDDLYNVYGLLPGENPSLPGIMIMAHTDTVFPAQTNLQLKQERGLVHGPGLGDNSMGVAGMLGLAYYLHQRSITPACNLWFVATSREEGLGDLGGARLAFATLQEAIGSVINVEGLAYGYIYNAGIAVRRLHITAQAAGGHSWLHFGRASAIHSLMQLGAAITEITPPQIPRTTYNIGLIEGGHSINSIATNAGLWLDLRSEDPDHLTALENDVMNLVHARQDDRVDFHIEIVGDRPAGYIDPNHPLILGALAALAENGLQGTLQMGSTDGNIPLAQGCPTATIGITRGGNAHRLDEFIEISPTQHGVRQLVLLTLAAAAHQAQLPRQAK